MEVGRCVRCPIEKRVSSSLVSPRTYVPSETRHGNCKRRRCQQVQGVSFPSLRKIARWWDRNTRVTRRNRKHPDVPDRDCYTWTFRSGPRARAIFPETGTIAIRFRNGSGSRTCVPADPTADSESLGRNASTLGRIRHLSVAGSTKTAKQQLNRGGPRAASRSYARVS